MELKRIAVNGESYRSISVQPVTDAAESTIRLSDLKQSPGGVKESFNTTLAVKEGPFTQIDPGNSGKSTLRGKGELVSVPPPDR